MNYLRLILLFFRVNLLGELAYRSNFIIRLFQSLLELATSIGGLAVIFSHTTTLGGWRPDEVLALVGVYLLMGGIIGLIIQPGMTYLTEAVRDGTLDFALTKPEDAQLIISMRRIEIWNMIDMALGLAVLFLALFRLKEVIVMAEAAMFIVMLFAGTIIVYSFWLMLATLSFWLVRVENILVIFQSMYEAGRWPISLYPSWLRFALTFIVPVAFATTVPAEALTGRLSLRHALITLFLAVVLFLIARMFWRVGLRRYSGTSA